MRNVAPGLCIRIRRFILGPLTVLAATDEEIELQLRADCKQQVRVKRLATVKAIGGKKHRAIKDPYHDRKLFSQQRRDAGERERDVQERGA